jgi:hypothetical protein
MAGFGGWLSAGLAGSEVHGQVHLPRSSWLHPRPVARPQKFFDGRQPDKSLSHWCVLVLKVEDILSAPKAFHRSRRVHDKNSLWPGNMPYVQTASQCAVFRSFYLDWIQFLVGAHPELAIATIRRWYPNDWRTNLVDGILGICWPRALIFGCHSQATCVLVDAMAPLLQAPKILRKTDLLAKGSLTPSWKLTGSQVAIILGELELWYHNWRSGPSCRQPKRHFCTQIEN